MDDVRGEKPAYPIESVDNALTLLRMFGEGGVIRVADASAEIGVARSTAHRLLAMLQYHGFVQQDPTTRAYGAGPALLMTGLAAIRKLDVRNQARPHLRRLSEQTGETVHLVTRRTRSVLFLDAVESSQAVRVSSRVGALMPAHCTSVGKALLAQLDDGTLAELYPDQELAGLTPSSITSRTKLFKELTSIRESGFATSSGEAESGVGSVGVAIVHPSGLSEAAISVSAPDHRLNKRTMAAYAKDCIAAAEAISGSFV